MVIGIMWRFHPDGSIENGRRPLIGLATDEAVKFIEAGMRRPTIKQSGNGHLPRWRFVILAKGGRAESILSQHLCERCDTLRSDASIAGKSRGEFHDRARVVDVMITSR